MKLLGVRLRFLMSAPLLARKSSVIGLFSAEMSAVRYYGDSRHRVITQERSCHNDKLNDLYR
jgi:hypothetical protein